MGQQINPIAAIAVVVIVLLVAGGIWALKGNPAAGKPGAGQAGNVDPYNAPGSSMMRQQIEQQQSGGTATQGP
jgi:hypothetical protein